MIFVPMGQHQPDNIAAPLFEPGDFGQHQINPHHIGLGEHQAAIDKQKLPFTFDRQHIHADFAQSPQGKQTDKGMSSGNSLWV